MNNVRLVDFMGSDAAVVRAARVSYGEGSKGLEKDANLIKYLMQHDHMTPFEMVQLTFHIKCPIFIARQWMRHRTGSFNEISLRYTEPTFDFYMPDNDHLKRQSATNKQGGDGEYSAVECAVIKEIMTSAMNSATEAYNKLIYRGVARETARMVLPVSLYTEFYWSVNLRNALHFVELRYHEGAQQLMQDYAKEVLYHCTMVAPISVNEWSSKNGR